MTRAPRAVHSPPDGAAPPGAHPPREPSLRVDIGEELPALRRWGLWLGPACAALAWLLVPVSYVAADGAVVELGNAARGTAAAGAWMAVWWLSEAVDIAITSLLPVALLPLLGGFTVKAVAAPFGHELVFLFMGGFMLALAMQRWGLHLRIALLVLRGVGSEPRVIIGAFMATTAFISAWVSNTATTTMMLPVAMSVIGLVSRAGDDTADPERRRSERHFAVALMLGVAYASTIGGMASILGTTPNLFLVSYARDQLGVEISFLDWLRFGVPLTLMYIPVAWWLLTRVAFPMRLPPIAGSRALARREWDALGPPSRGELLTLLVFAGAAAAWVLRPWLATLEIGGEAPLAQLSDAGIAVFAAIALFVLPTGRGPVLDWATGSKLPWGVLLLFGGGFSLAAAIDASGLGGWVGQAMSGLGTLPALVLTFAVGVVVIAVGEFASNVAATATLVPVLASVATAIGMPPLALIVPVTLASSCSFALPVGTPPNAIVYGTGHIRMGDMLRAGLLLDAAGVLLITAITQLFVLPMFG